jgi:hypothetical protein
MKNRRKANEVKNKTPLAAIAAVMLLLFPVSAFADSSWAWLTDARPIYILPFAVVFTVTIEVFIISKYNHIKKIWIVLLVICLSNSLSFCAQYILAVVVDPNDNCGYTFQDTIDNLPTYMVTAYYYILTIFVELPVVFLCLYRYVQNRTKLILTIIIANTITTALVAICERLICVGSW